VNEFLALVAIGAFVAAALTVPAGFGLSTILTPLVLVLMPPHEAVAVVAIVHGAHNAGKLALLWENVDFTAFKRYGIWLVVGSIIGAVLQSQVPQRPLLGILGLALMILPILTISERWTGYRIPEANDRFGGFGSGFMGGLSGHQGALRAMFLSKRIPDKMSYAATASILALCVDLSRIPVYLAYRSSEIYSQLSLILVLVVSALIGARVGKRWLKSLNSELIRNGVMTGIMLSGALYLLEAAS
tara:strand:- start:20632 stop:21363 length:732 start_codon:yes stop_codon:yes gene_type:complete